MAVMGNTSPPPIIHHLAARLAPDSVFAGARRTAMNHTANTNSMMVPSKPSIAHHNQAADRALSPAGSNAESDPPQPPSRSGVVIATSFANVG